MDEKKRNEQSIPSDKAAELTDKMLDSVTGGAFPLPHGDRDDEARKTKKPWKTGG